MCDKLSDRKADNKKKAKFGSPDEAVVLGGPAVGARRQNLPNAKHGKMLLLLALSPHLSGLVCLIIHWQKWAKFSNSYKAIEESKHGMRVSIYQPGTLGYFLYIDTNNE